MDFPSFPRNESNLNNIIIHKNCEIESNIRATTFQVSQQKEVQDKFKDTFLYQIMTDPEFIENIQKTKKRNIFSCQFCKREFETETEIQDHLTARFDESKRV